MILISICFFRKLSKSSSPVPTNAILKKGANIFHIITRLVDINDRNKPTKKIINIVNYEKVLLNKIIFISDCMWAMKRSRIFLQVLK